MLSNAVSRRRAAPHRRRWWAAALRWQALITLVFGTPNAQQVLAQVASVIAPGTDDCEEECEDGDCGRAPCTTCHDCAHSSALALVPLAVPLRCETGQFVKLVPADLELSGYESPPFKPPTV